MIEEIYQKLLKSKDASSIKSLYKIDDERWQNISKKIYCHHYKNEQAQREIDNKSKNTICTPNETINEMMRVNDILVEKALCIPHYATMADLKNIKCSIEKDTVDESLAINAIERVIMTPKIRASQQKGRFEEFDIFQDLSKVIEASTISYFRGNYISSYLTILPIFEGVIVRWMNKYESSNRKPFEKIRKFIIRSFERQPCPGNILFHKIYTIAADKILNEHLYKPNENETSHLFNRHDALHMHSSLNVDFKKNAIRAFLLLDLLSEIYRYECYLYDPAFNLTYEKVSDKLTAYIKADQELKNNLTPEHLLV